MPPMYSAIKHQGQPLYKLAREGKTVTRKPRQVVIHDLQLLNYADNKLVLDISCSKGTYIRTLAEDIGEALGTCAFIAGLRRTLAAPFNDDQLAKLDALQQIASQGLEQLDALLLPPDVALSGWPSVTLTQEQAVYMRQGQAVLVPRSPGSGLLKLYCGDSKSTGFIGIGKVLDDGRIGPKRLIFTGN